MLQQLRFFIQDYSRATGKYWFRGFYIWLSFSIIGIFFYRLERGLFLIFGNFYRFLRVPLSPLLYLIEALSHVDINYHADIKGGLVILHHSMGVVINGGAIIGKNLTLTGGNVIGGKKSFKRGDFVIGDNCFLGANAVIMGPLIMGNSVAVGASACVVKDVPTDATVGGVPAKIIKQK